MVLFGVQGYSASIEWEGFGDGNKESCQRVEQAVR